MLEDDAIADFVEQGETETHLAIIRERQLVALYLHQFAGSQVDPVEVAEAVLTGAHMVAT
jgi:hypothetical protein